MTPNTPENQVEQPKNDKELNFRALEQRYQRQLEQERAARLEAERQVQESRQKTVHDDDEDDSEPYIDRKKLNKAQAKFGQQMKQETQSEIQKAVGMALHEERKQNWMKQNNDFHEVLQHAQKLYEKDPELAETILEMPEGFERQKLVYKNIKAFGLHKPPEKVSSIQEKVDANRKSPYYQPSGVGSTPYSNQSDYSPAGQKSAYDKMKDLQARLRI